MNQLSQLLRQYFEALHGTDSVLVHHDQTEWRMACYRSGLAYADYIERHSFQLRGKSVLDPACAWGGHAVAFASRGATVTASEINNHCFTRLMPFCKTQRLDVQLCLADCERLPFGAATFDVVLAFELIEHINSVDRFAAEVSRVLRPGGVCLVSTPARLRSVIEGEPHFGIRGLSLLPFKLQGWVARKLFRRQYPYPITRQYTLAAEVIRSFRNWGLEGRPVFHGRIARRIAACSCVHRAASQVLWNFLVFRKPDQS